MARRKISSFSKRGIALTVLSKLLYAVAGRTMNIEEIKTLHHNLLAEVLIAHESARDTDNNDPVPIENIPWSMLLDTIAYGNASMIKYKESGKFTVHELRYMCAMMCGVTGEEYKLISGFKSQYNLSWSIRYKLGMQPKTTNLGKFLQNLPDEVDYERWKGDVPK